MTAREFLGLAAEVVGVPPPRIRIPLWIAEATAWATEVLNLATAEIEDTPDFGDGTATPYLLGMAKSKGKVKILLEIDRVMSNLDLHGLGALAQ